MTRASAILWGVAHEGHRLPPETTVNNPRDFGLNKDLSNLEALRSIGQHVNARLLETELVSHNCVLIRLPSTVCSDPPSMSMVYAPPLFVSETLASWRCFKPSVEASRRSVEPDDRGAIARAVTWEPLPRR